MALFFLILGFAVGAAFYVVAGRDSESGGLDLPLRFGLVLVVGLVLGLGGQMFVKQSEQEMREAIDQAVEREQAQRERVPQTAAAPASTAESVAGSGSKGGTDSATESALASSAQSAAGSGNNGGSGSPTQAAPASLAQSASGNGNNGGSGGAIRAASSPDQVNAPTETPATDRTAGTPPPAAPGSSTSGYRDSELNCAYSMDTDKCLCVDASGAIARIDFERCKAVATAGEE